MRFYDGMTFDFPRTTFGSTLGRIDAGTLADLVVLDRDPFDARTDLADVAVRATMVGGRLVHGSSELGG